MEFRILGPLHVRGDGGERIEIGGSRSEAMLAALILESGRPVPVDDLARFAWDDHPPATARKQVRNRVTGLRRRLVAAGFPEGVIRAEGQTFSLHPAGAAVDSQDFLRYAAGAQAVPAADRAGAVALLRKALGLWRGPALAGLDGQRVTAAAARLNELRLSTWERCIALELELGRHHDVLGELTDLVGRYPTHEQFVGQLMLAFYRSGRQADAIAAYVAACRHLATELGIDPGEELRETYQRILRNESPPVQVSAGPQPSPAQLPADAAGFVGRADQLAWLDAATHGVVAVVGLAGVGKSALAIHFGHRVAHRFPDGQLFADMRGYSGDRPLSAAEVLGRFLRALGVPPESVPDEAQEAAALYRSVLAGKRVLVIADNVAGADDALPLLPGTPGSLLLVTSRDRLTGLVAEGARRIVLDVLPPADAVALLRATCAGAPDELEALARACGHLPLALRIAAAHLADHPQWSVGEYLRHLDADRLEELRIDGHVAVRAVLDQSYARLSEQARHMLRTLGAHPGADVSLDAAAAAAEAPTVRARRALDALMQAHLLEQHRPDRYRLHDLVAEYARELSTPEARRRFSDWYLSTLDNAVELLYPDMLRLPGSVGAGGLTFKEQRAASGWLEAELANLLAVVRDAAVHGPWHCAWLVNDRLFGYFWHVRSVRDWLEITQAALDAATRAGDAAGCASALSSQGTALRAQGRHDEAIEVFRCAREHARQAGWTAGEGRIELRMGTAHYDLGRLTLAQEHLERSRQLYGRAGYRTGLTVALANLGVLSRKRGLLRQAAHHSQQALAHYREQANEAGIGLALGNLALINHGLGRLREARACAHESLAVERQGGRRYGQAVNLCNLALILSDLGEHRIAAHHAEQAIELAREMGKAREEASALAAHATVMARLGRAETATEHFRLARKVAVLDGAPDLEAEALIGLAHLHRAAGEFAAALRDARRAARIARDGGFQLIAAIARAGLAAVHLSRGTLETARDEADQAIAFLRAAGARQEEGRALVALGSILHAAGEAAPARRRWQAAARLLGQCGSFDTHVAVRLLDHPALV